MYMFVLLMCCLKIRVKYDFTRIVPSTQVTPSCYGALVLRRRECTQATLGCSCAPGMAQRGYEFLIPTSGRRLGIWGGRCPTLAFQLGNRSRCAWPGGLPHTVYLYIVVACIWYDCTWVVLLFDFNIMFVLPNFIMLIKFVKLYYCVFPEFILIHI